MKSMTKTEEISRNVLTGEYFMNGDIACAEGAIAGGCTFFAGYPITPSTEIAERISRRFQITGGVYLQMEDEIASITAIMGGSWGGRRAMTATSGPGFSLMMEGIGLGVMTETPCVIVDVQRAGPSTGLPTLVGQQDIMQARWGSHGDYRIIAFVPNSAQEMFECTYRAFNIAEKYRVPVFVMADEVVGHTTEKVTIPPAAELPIYPRRRPRTPPGDFLPFKPDEDLVPPMACAGEGYRIHVTSLTHDERGYPVINAEMQDKLVRRLSEKITRNAPDIIDVEETMTDDADAIIVSYGISSRSSMEALKLCRKKGLKVGLFRPITIWPFPEERIRLLSRKVKALIVVEINLGQIFYEVERCCGRYARVHLISGAGGRIHTPSELVRHIESIMEKCGKGEDDCD
jgi:2-oxoglutarate/2-oxoacid ferredoxin oxidoreductase subunit alpha